MMPGMDADGWPLSRRFDHGMFVSTFETSIRVLGGLLSAYAMTHDKMYVAKATDLADRLSRAFSYVECRQSVATL